MVNKLNIEFYLILPTSPTNKEWEEKRKEKRIEKREEKWSAKHLLVPLSHRVKWVISGS